MSFSTKTKDELSHIFPEKVCCQMAELAALVRMDGTLIIGANHQIGLQINMENAAVARKVFRLIKQIFQIESEIRVMRRMRLKKRYLYNIRIYPRCEMRDVLIELGLLDERGNLSSEIKPSLVKRKCCRRSYLRGVFLGAGSVNNPEGNYHLEIITGSLEHAQSLVNLINEYKGLQAKISSRKNWHVVYFKESEQIVHFLNIIGAHRALLDFENVRIVKEMRNQVNRLVNCETANLNKTVTASFRQIDNIKFIDEILGIDKLPLPLQQIAGLRLENPDVSLKELGEMMEPQVGKSGVNHRMRKIEKIADDLRERVDRIHNNLQ